MNITLIFASLDFGMAQYLAIAGAGAVVALIGLALRKPLQGHGAVPGWLAGSIAGFLLGSGIAFVLLHQLGYGWLEQPPVIQVMPNVVAGGVAVGQGGQPGGGPGGGGPGGNRPPVTPTAVVNLVKKLNLLDVGLKIELSSEQASRLSQALAGLDDDDTMSNEEAEKRMEACVAVLMEDQKAIVASIDLPRRRGQGGGGAGGAGGAPAMPGDARGGGPAGGQGGSGPAKNPFKGEEEGMSLESLRARLAEHAK